MNTYQSTPDFYRDYIQHFNKNHDPKNGQFTSGHGGLSINSNVKKLEKTGGANKSNFDSKEKVHLNERELKKWYKNAKETPTSKMFDYGEEFNESPKGKQLIKKCQDAWDLDWDDPSTEEKFDKAENDWLRERQKYAVTKFLKNDAKNYTLQQIAYDSYPMYGKPKSVSEQDVKNYLLNEQWKLHKE